MRVRGGREDDERLRGERGSKTPEFKRRVLRGVIAEDRLNERGKSALHARLSSSASASMALSTRW